VCLSPAYPGNTRRFSGCTGLFCRQIQLFCEHTDCKIHVSLSCLSSENIADEQMDKASIQGSFVNVWGSFADILGFFPENIDDQQINKAEKQVCLATIQDSFVNV